LRRIFPATGAKNANNIIKLALDPKSVAVLVDAGLFARIRCMRNRFDALSGQVAEAYADATA
jgi:hypothetical protein